MFGHSVWHSGTRVATTSGGGGMLVEDCGSCRLGIVVDSLAVVRSCNRILLRAATTLPESQGNEERRGEGGTART